MLQVRDQLYTKLMGVTPPYHDRMTGKCRAAVMQRHIGGCREGTAALSAGTETY